MTSEDDIVERISEEENVLTLLKGLMERQGRLHVYRGVERMVRSGQQITRAERTLGLDQRLVQSWKTSMKQGPQWPGHWVPGRREDEVSIYVEPKTGIFYTRVPETDEGTLYAEHDLRVLRERVCTAVRGWLQGLDEEVEDTRTWEPMIRVIYKPGTDRYSSIVAALSHHPHRSWDQAYDIEPCRGLGVLFYSRYERARTPDGLWDERELESDFQARIDVWNAEKDKDRWRSRYTLEQLRQSKPVRQTGRTGADGLVSHRNMGYHSVQRLFPYTDSLWESLRHRAAAFAKVDAAILEMFRDATPEQLEASPAPHLFLMTKDAT